MFMKKNNIMLFLGIFVLFEPIICIKYKITNAFYIIGAIVSFIIIFFNYIKEGTKISKTLVYLIIYRMIVFFPTIINQNGDILKWGYSSITIITLYMILHKNMKNNFKNVINILVNIFLILLFINIISYIFFPKGLYFDSSRYSYLYFLGIRTRFTDYAYTGLILNLINLKLEKRLRFKTVLGLIICLLNIIVPSIATGIIALLVFLLTLLFFKLVKNNKSINYNIFVYIFLIINILVVVFNIQNVILKSLFELLGKSVSLTGRTEIWSLSWHYINEKLFLGHGLINDGNFVLWNGVYWQGHNQLIQCLYDSGILGTILFILILFSPSKNLKKCTNEGIKAILISGLFAYMLMMITEISAYYLPLFLVLFIAENCIYLENGDKKS